MKLESDPKVDAEELPAQPLREARSVRARHNMQEIPPDSLDSWPMTVSARDETAWTYRVQ